MPRTTVSIFNIPVFTQTTRGSRSKDSRSKSGNQFYWVRPSAKSSSSRGQESQESYVSLTTHESSIL
jgi:hypothetical protein